MGSGPACPYLRKLSSKALLYRFAWVAEDHCWRALRALGPSSYHRHSFTGVAAPWATGHPAVTNDLPDEEGNERRGPRALRGRHGAAALPGVQGRARDVPVRIETERRFYLANKFDLQVRNQDGDTYFDITLHDAWVWDMYRPARFVTRVRVVTFKDVNVEEFIRKEGI